MSTRFDELMTTINRKRETERASDRAVAKMVGMTVAEFDADTTALNPRLPDHDQRKNKARRQVCCTTCHKCGGDLRKVLDGELWCNTCGAYR